MQNKYWELKVERDRKPFYSYRIVLDAVELALCSIRSDYLVAPQTLKPITNPMIYGSAQSTHHHQSTPPNQSLTDVRRASCVVRRASYREQKENDQQITI